VSNEIQVSQRVVSTAEGWVGNWSYSTTITLAGVPRPDDFITFGADDDGGGFTESVKDTCWRTDGTVQVELRPVKTDSPEVIRHLEARGWERHAGPWAGQDQESTEEKA
jgi:hypothetical protein